LIEKWVGIKGFETLFMVSSCGRVKALPRKIRTRSNGNGNPYLKKEHLMKGSLTRKGYRYVTLRKNNQPLLKYVHRLVAEAFIPNPDNLASVNHIDGNKENNNVNNLEWMSLRDNSLDGIKKGLIKVTGEHKGTAKLNIEEVKNMRKLYRTGLKPKAISQRFNVTENCAYHVVTRRTWRHIN
jgi:hypothetical protein